MSSLSNTTAAQFDNLTTLINVILDTYMKYSADNKVFILDEICSQYYKDVKHKFSDKDWAKLRMLSVMAIAKYKQQSV